MSNNLLLEQIKTNRTKNKEKFLKEKNEYLQENKNLVKKENYDNLNLLENYITIYPKVSQDFFKQTEHKYDYFYKLYRHLQQNYFAKKFKVKLFDPNSKLKNNKEKYFIFRPWGNEPNNPYYNHSILLQKQDNTIKLYDTMLYPIIITNDKGKKKAKRDENKKLIENIKLNQQVLENVKRFFKRNNIDNNISVEESDFLQDSKKKISKSQKSSAGCFEMCLYSYFIFNKRDIKINNLTSKEAKQKKKIINETNSQLWNFAKKIKLKFKGNGTKDKNIFNMAMAEIEKILFNQTNNSKQNL